MSEAAGSTPSARRFSCTPGGTVAAGQRRLRWLLLGPAGLMVATGAATFASGRAAVGALCLLVALVAFVAWRMSGELVPLWIDVGSGEVAVRTRTTRPTLALAGCAARRLTDAERGHVEGLASTAGVVAPAGSFDSRLLGEFDLFASDLRHAVLVESDDARWVVTPDDPRAFVDELSRRATA